jgi:hypothetical protein
MTSAKHGTLQRLELHVWSRFGAYTLYRLLNQNKGLDTSNQTRSEERHRQYETAIIRSGKDSTEPMRLCTTNLSIASTSVAPFIQRIPDRSFSLIIATTPTKSTQQPPIINWPFHGISLHTHTRGTPLPWSQKIAVKVWVFAPDIGLCCYWWSQFYDFFVAVGWLGGWGGVRMRRSPSWRYKVAVLPDTTFMSDWTFLSMWTSLTVDLLGSFRR